MKTTENTPTAHLRFFEHVQNGVRVKVLHQLVNRPDGLTCFWQEVPTEVLEPGVERTDDAQRL